MMSVSCVFGTTPRRTSPLWKKIERAAAELQQRHAEADEFNKALVERRKRQARARECRVRREYHRVQKALWLASLLPPERILAEVAKEHGVRVADIQSHRFSGGKGARVEKFTLARRDACWRLYSETALSLPQIGRLMGGRDHTTILHNVEAYMRRNEIGAPAHRMRK